MSYVNYTNVNGTDYDLHDRRLTEFSASDAGKIPVINSLGTGFEYGSGGSGVVTVEANMFIGMSTQAPTGAITVTDPNFYSTISTTIMAGQPVLLSSKLTLENTSIVVGRYDALISNYMYALDAQYTIQGIDSCSASLVVSFDGQNLVLVNINIDITEQSISMATVPSMGG